MLRILVYMYSEAMLWIGVVYDVPEIPSPTASQSNKVVMGFVSHHHLAAQTSAITAYMCVHTPARLIVAWPHEGQSTHFHLGENRN